MAGRHLAAIVNFRPRAVPAAASPPGYARDMTVETLAQDGVRQSSEERECEDEVRQESLKRLADGSAEKGFASLMRGLVEEVVYKGSGRVDTAFRHPSEITVRKKRGISLTVLWPQ